ncbi:uncharacterized protein TrAtP1_000925 [Trichoderma atroviride]|uniref:uncharacterized protein n=1 Tax=Hypocrea atroviridis TaxID=63577 RepID=UPI003316E73E|nr:hypothetical protein TrAtP1_000925 [Trichoderma atroviride]
MGFQPASSRSRLRKTAKRRLDLADAVEAFMLLLALPCPSVRPYAFPLPSASSSVGDFASLQRLRPALANDQSGSRLSGRLTFDLLATVDDPCCQPDSPSCIYASVMRSARHGQQRLCPDSSFQLWGHCSRPMAANQASPDGEGFDNGWLVREASRLDCILSNGSRTR